MPVFYESLYFNSRPLTTQLAILMEELKELKKFDAIIGEDVCHCLGVGINCASLFDPGRRY